MADTARPTDARRVAIDAIVRIDDGGAYANVVLPGILAETDLEPRDKAFVTELVYGSTRRKRALDHVVDRFLLQDPPTAARAALRIGAHQLIEMGTPPHAAVSATVSAAPKRAQRSGSGDDPGTRSPGVPASKRIHGVSATARPT